MTAVTYQTSGSASRMRTHEILRIVRLHCVNPSVYFGVPLMILGGAWVITLIITGLIIAGTGEPVAYNVSEGQRYSWAVISPQWYLVVVGVQAVAYTFSFALGFGSTRRDYWLGTGLMFALTSAGFALLLACLVQIEKMTTGWFIGAHMFDTLWYGVAGFGVDFFTAFSMQLFVLFVGAGVTAVFMRWRMRGMLVLAFSFIALVLAAAAALTFTGTWPSLFGWLGSLGIVGAFTLVLGLAMVSAVGGYLVIRKATPR